MKVEASMDTADMSAGPPKEQAIVSRTTVTNAEHRNSPHRPHADRKKTVTQSPRFLAAERFQSISSHALPSEVHPPQKTSSGSTERDGGGIAANGSQVFSCVTQNPKQGRPRTPNNSAHGRSQWDEVLRNARDSVMTPEGRAKLAPMARQKAEGCVNATQKHLPDEDQIRSCLRQAKARRVQLEQCVADTYDTVQTECQIFPPVESHHRGGDADFFRRPSPPRETHHPQRHSYRNKHHQPDSVKNESMDEESDVYNEPEPFRSPRGMRYPAAAKIHNPNERDYSEREIHEEVYEAGDDDVREDGVVGESVDLRDFRLGLFQHDGLDKTVSQARLARALSELSIQDETIRSLEKALTGTKTSLGLAEKQLIETRESYEKQKSTIANLRTEAARQKTLLEKKLKQESRERSKLETSISTLQVETSRLKASLRSARAELRRQNDRWRTLSGDDSLFSGLDESSLFPSSDSMVKDDEEESAVVIALRAEIVNLKAQLADAKASGLSSKPSEKAGVRAELARLRAHLESCETELAALRENEQKEQHAAEYVVVELEEKLKEKEDELAIAHKNLAAAKLVESALRGELEDAKEKVAKLQKQQALLRMNSLVEVESLRDKLEAAQSEAQEAKMRVQALIFERNNLGVDGLKNEVQCLSKKLFESTQELIVKNAERLQERQILETQLSERKKNVESLQLRVRVLEARLTEKSNVDSETSSIGSISLGSNGINRRSVFDKEHAMLARGENQIALRNELSRSRESEEKLRAEVEVMKDLLRCSEATASESRAEVEDENREREEKEAQLSNDLDDLKKKLADPEAETKRLLESRAADGEARGNSFNALLESQAKEQLLRNEVHNLKASLRRAEIQCQQEKLRAEEERRISKEVEAERLVEIERLSQQVQTQTITTDSDMSTRVMRLEQCLAATEKELEETRREAGREAKAKDEETMKLRSALAVTKAKLASTRKSPTILDRSDRIFPSSSNDSISSVEMSDSPKRLSCSVSLSEITPPRRNISSSRYSEGRFLQSPPRWTVPHVVKDESASPTRKRQVDLMSLRRRLQESNQRLLDANIRLEDMSFSSVCSGTEQKRPETPSHGESQSGYISPDSTNSSRRSAPSDEPWDLANEI